MNAKQQIEGGLKLGELVAAAYDLGTQVASDPSAAAELAARRLERVLLRGGNPRLQAAIAAFAKELRPSRPRAASSTPASAQAAG
jgi:hypothetical protein